MKSSSIREKGRAKEGGDRERAEEGLEKGGDVKYNIQVM